MAAAELIVRGHRVGADPDDRSACVDEDFVAVPEGTCLGRAAGGAAYSDAGPSSEQTTADVSNLPLITGQPSHVG
jgi:hypothetical protein